MLKVLLSGYYDWRHRTPSARSMTDVVLTKALRKAHKDADHTYEMPRIRAELRENG